jgi:mannose-6-phosphate isomerase-like protein (cupin superfamily)
MIRKAAEVPGFAFENCHDGQGALLCRSMLQPGDTEQKILFFHHDYIPAGVSIGQHLHTGNEEIYYLLSGHCTLIYDGQEMPMEPGDFSIVRDGHTHGLVNSGSIEAQLIVVGVGEEE